MKSGKKKGIIGVIVAVAIVTAAIIVCLNLFSGKKLNVSDYIKLKYSGISGYATVTADIDREAMYEAMIKDTNDSGKKEASRKFCDEIEVSADGTNISNGDTVTVNLNFDISLVKEAGYKVPDNQLVIKAEGIDEGEKIDVFSFLTVKLSGISPNINLTLENTSTDEWFKEVEFTADQTTGLSNGDTIKITCTTSKNTFAEHGYVPISLTTEYKIEGVGDSINNTSEIESDKLNELDELCKATINSQTEDQTYRMLYKVTGNTDYLYLSNDEKAENIQQVGKYYLNGKGESTQNLEFSNEIVMIYTADIVCGDKRQNLAFAFTFKNISKDSSGNVTVDTSNIEQNFTYADNANTLKQNLIDSLSGKYDITEINN